MRCAQLQRSTFQSAPRSVERGDWPSSARDVTRSGFNPRPAQSSGATAARARVPRLTYVSIRAPLSRAGRRCAIAVDHVHVRVSIRAPLSRAGRRLSERQTDLRVSIRAPLSRAGRRDDLVRSPRLQRFQSAPRSVERGDASDLGASRATSIGFNPRPAQSSGATRSTMHSALRRVMFQSAPRSVERGDRSRRPHRERMLLFQSAPRSVERGDAS